MLRLTVNPTQRTLFAEKLLDTGNLALAAMVFGQFLGVEAFSAWNAALGFALWAFLAACAAELTRGAK